MKNVILVAFSVFFLISNLNAEGYSVHIIEKCSQWKEKNAAVIHAPRAIAENLPSATWTLNTPVK